MGRVKGLLFCWLLLFCIAYTASAMDRPLRGLFKDVNQAVVVIQTSEHEYAKDHSGELLTSESLGSGVIVSPDGLIMTAAHVINVANTINVKLLDGSVFSATPLGSIDAADIALIRLDHTPKGLPVAKLGNSDMLHVGDEIFVVGAPYGVEHTLTVGHISGRRIPLNLSAHLVPVEYLQTDAAINQGNSGGPMFNMQGEVVGIVSHILTQSGGFEGLGFAASINVAKELLLEQRPFYSGMEFYYVSGELAAILNVPQEASLLIQRVALNSLGQRLGLRQSKIHFTFHGEEMFIGGDIILEIQGLPITTDMAQMKKLRQAISDTAPGNEFTCKVLRAGKIVSLSTTR